MILASMESVAIELRRFLLFVLLLMLTQMLTTQLLRQMCAIMLHHIVLTREATGTAWMKTMKVLFASVDAVVSGKMAAGGEALIASRLNAVVLSFRLDRQCHGRC